MTLLEQINYRLDEIEKEAQRIQRAADGWEYYQMSTASHIRNEVHNIHVDLAQLRHMFDKLNGAADPMGWLLDARSERLPVPG